MLCHSVRYCQLPSLSLNRSLVAKLNLATGVPWGVYLTSGSLPRRPRRMTLLTLFPAMRISLRGDQYTRSAGVEKGERGGEFFVGGGLGEGQGGGVRGRTAIDGGLFCACAPAHPSLRVVS